MALAHRAGHGVLQQIVCFGIPPDKLKGSTDHVSSGSGYDGIGFCMYTSAQFVTLSGRNLQSFAGTDAQIGTVFAAARSAVIPGRNNLIVAYDDCTVFPP